MLWTRLKSTGAVSLYQLATCATAAQLGELNPSNTSNEECTKLDLCHCTSNEECTNCHCTSNEECTKLDLCHCTSNEECTKLDLCHCTSNEECTKLDLCHWRFESCLVPFHYSFCFECEQLPFQMYLRLLSCLSRAPAEIAGSYHVSHYLSHQGSWVS